MQCRLKCGLAVNRDLQIVIEALDNGASVAVANEGRLLGTATGRGVTPLLEVLKSVGDTARGGVFADKVVGRAAAMVIVDAGARQVYARVMSVPAQDVLVDAGIPAGADELPDRIANRDGTGLCPMEELSFAHKDPRLFRLELEKRFLS